MINDDMEEKIITFNPTGFILKTIFSVGLTVFMGNRTAESMAERGGLLYLVMNYVLFFVCFWFLATLFGFSLRASGNYIVAVVLMLILMAAGGAGMEWLSTKNALLGDIANIAFILLVIWLPIRDIRKAILYFKSTV